MHRVISYFSILNPLIQCRFIFTINTGNSIFLSQVVSSPAAEINNVHVATHCICSGLPQHYHSCLALCVQDHGHETVPAGVYKEELWEERELDCSHSPDGTPKPRMDWAVLAKAKGQEKARAMRMV